MLSVAEAMSIGIMLRPCEQQRNKLDGTDCVGPKSSSTDPSSCRPSRAQASSPSVVRGLETNTNASNTQNRPPSPKTWTAAPRDRSQHGGVQEDGSTHGKSERPARHTLFALGVAAEIKQGEKARPPKGAPRRKLRDKRPTEAQQPGSSRPVLKSGAAS